MTAKEIKEQYAILDLLLLWWVSYRSAPKVGLFVCWLLNVPATCETDLFRQFYVLPHWDRSCRPNFPSHPVTVYWHWADQSQHWPYNARCLAVYPLECQFLSHWYDSTPEKSRRKRDSNSGSSTLEVDALTTRLRRSLGGYTVSWKLSLLPFSIHCCTVIFGLLSAPVYKPHALFFLKILVLSSYKPHWFISRMCDILEQSIQHTPKPQ